MLQRLSITNLATIARLTVDFGEGFSTLTGETGTGKSILIDALRLVLGERASAQWIRSGTKFAAVEACFSLEALPQVETTLEELGIIAEDHELILRRLIQNSGRSRLLVNDQQLTLTQLNRVVPYLVSIHGQHDSQLLLQPEQHLFFLDAFAGLQPTRRAYQKLQRQWSATRQQIIQREEASEQRQREQEFLRERIETLEAIAPENQEDDELRREIELLSHGEQRFSLSERLCILLYEGDDALQTQLAEAEHLLEEVTALDARLKPTLEGLRPLRFQLEGVYDALRSYRQEIEVDPGRLEEAQSRLALLEKRMRQHGVSSATALQAALEADRRALRAMEEGDEQLQQLKERLQSLHAALKRKADALSAGRSKAAEAFGRQVQDELTLLGLPQGQFTVALEPLSAAEKAGTRPKKRAPNPTEEAKRPTKDSAERMAARPAEDSETRDPETQDAGARDASAWGTHGAERARFLLSLNPGQPPRPLSSIASGGELSRIMLALKTVLQRVDPTRTLIFDEIDTGISGAQADTLGHKLRRLGAYRQVLCVTHLPQVAALGHAHLLVRKSVVDEATYTQIETLTEASRVDELARMLSGQEVSDHARQAARELLRQAETGDEAKAAADEVSADEVSTDEVSADEVASQTESPRIKPPQTKPSRTKRLKTNHGG